MAYSASSLKNIPLWNVVVVLLLPILYWINACMPWTRHLFIDGDSVYWGQWIGSIMALHWLSVLLIVFFLKKQNLGLKDLGYSLGTLKTIFFVGSFFLLAFIIYISCERGVQVTSFASYGGQSSLMPVTSQQRLMWIFACFSAGFCEELIYRGFAMRGLLPVVR